MREDELVYEAALAAIRDGSPAVIATVVEVQGSTPRTAGAKMLIRGEGSTVGTVGGGGLEANVRRDAQKALQDNQSRLVSYSLEGESENHVGACGGKAVVFLDVIHARPRLVIAGAGHVAESLAALAGIVGFHTVVVDDRADLLTRERFPRAEELVCTDFHELTQRVLVDARTAVAIVTRGHDHDETVLRQVVSSKAWYIGMIGSRAKVQTVFESLLADGTSAEGLARVHAPIGLRTGGQTPAEIAVGIVAELLVVRYGGNGQPCYWRDNPLRHEDNDIPNRASAGGCA